MPNEFCNKEMYQLTNRIWAYEVHKASGETNKKKRIEDPDEILKPSVKWQLHIRPLVGCKEKTKLLIYNNV